MATFANRSKLFVKVPRRDDLLRTFPYHAAAAARQYLKQLRAQGLKPVLGQYEDSIVLRVRTKGYKPQQLTASSYEEAELIARRIEDEQRRGIFTDYARALHVTPAQLIERYIREECPRHKAGAIEAYKLRAFLEDSRGELKRKLVEDEAARKRGEAGAWVNGRKKPKRTPIESLEWLHKPLGAVQPTDIEEYVQARVEVVAPATADRELDLLAAVFNVAIKTWRYEVPRSPMDGVRRPKYWNERDRRLAGDEEERLLAAAREEDRLRSIARERDRLLEPYREEALSLSPANRKRYLAEVGKQVLAEAERSFSHVALFETFIRFQLATAARRGETLKLQWRHIDFHARTAFLPETKTGVPRKLPLMSDIVRALSELPRDEEVVFPISLDDMKNTWKRVCEQAGIEDLHVHDLRHEAVSRVADTGAFTLVDLQAYSGHKDARCLMRYAHLCMTSMAQRLDAAFARRSATYIHKGRRRLAKASGLAVGDVMQAPSSSTRGGVDRWRRVLSRMQSLSR